MKIDLKALLKIGEAVATSVIPGAGVVDEAIRAAVAAPHGLQQEVAYVQAGITVLDLLEKNYGVEFAAEPDFQAGLAQANAGFVMMIKGIQKHQDALRQTNPNPTLAGGSS